LTSLTLTGVGINDDLRKFDRVMRALYGEDLWDYTISAVELDTLARFAGYYLVRYSLAVLNLVVFGMIMLKGVPSDGNGLWHKRIREIPQPLHAYKAQDISQPAWLSWVFSACWILQAFPDTHAVSQVSTMNTAELFK
jgi:hypothetical protein